MCKKLATKNSVLDHQQNWEKSGKGGKERGKSKSERGEGEKEKNYKPCRIVKKVLIMTTSAVIIISTNYS